MEPSTNELMRESGVWTICEMFGPSNQTKCENSYSICPWSGLSCTLISWNILLKVSSSHSAAPPMRNVSWVFPQLSPTDQRFREMRGFVPGHTGPVKPGSDPCIIWDVTAVLAVSGIVCVFTSALSLTWSAAAVALTMSVKSWGLRELQRSAYQIISKPATAIMTLWGL